jgi:D-lactate dehydrogenase (cytochrome)
MPRNPWSRGIIHSTALEFHMAIHHIVTVAPRTVPELDILGCGLITDPDELDAIKTDAAAMQGRGARGLLIPRTESALCAFLRANPNEHIIAQGALTSLTGGATPDDDVVVSLKKLNHLQVLPDRKLAIAGPGLLLANLQESLADHGLYYPPAPTHDGASLGGNVATNAAGAGTFKYGTTRQWVRGIRLVLRSGDVLEIYRQQMMVAPGDTVIIDGKVPFSVPIPTYRSPSIKKSSAGYYVGDPVDLIDIFIGSEGTLGFITELTIELVQAKKLITGLVFFPSQDQTLDFTAQLRARSQSNRQSENKDGLDVRSIEFFDQRCLQLLRDENKLDGFSLTIPLDSQACLLFEQEISNTYDYDTIVDCFVKAAEGIPTPPNPVGELFDILTQFNVVDRCELALPNDPKRQKQLASVREAIPLSVSEFLIRQKKKHPGVHKAAGDMIVPFDRFGEMLEHYYEEFAKRGVDVAIFGHISDGNVHPNALPKDETDVRRAKEALLALGEIASSLGGCPLSEHGVGKHPLKKELLKRFWGTTAISEMRNLKAAFDPDWTLGRGVLFDPPDSSNQKTE